MSGIVQRTAFVDRENGTWRFHDYCVVKTSLGDMVEFDAPFQRSGINFTTIFDPTDQSTRVDKVESMKMDQRPAIFKDGETMLHESWYYKEGY